MRGKKTLFIIILITFFILTSGCGQASNADIAQASEPVDTVDSVSQSTAEISSQTKQEEIELPILYYFYDEACSSCVPDVESEFIALYNEVHGDIKEQYPMDLRMINIFKSEGRESYTELLTQYGLETPDSSPTVVISGVLLTGDAIAARMSEQCVVAYEMMEEGTDTIEEVKQQNALASEELFTEFELSDDSINMLYFYRIQCADCQSIEDFMDSLPKTVMVNGVEMPLNIIYINTREPRGGDRIYKLFEVYEVPSELQQVPILFYNGGYLSGAEPIETELLDIAEGEENSNLIGLTLP